MIYYDHYDHLDGQELHHQGGLLTPHQSPVEYRGMPQS